MSTSVTLRPPQVRDAHVMATVLSDPALYEYTGGGPPTVDDLVRRYTAQVRGHTADGAQQWVNHIVLLGERPIGYVQATITPAGEEADIAWVIGTSWQGFGHAATAAALLVHTLAARGVRRVGAYIHPSHTASQRVALRVGMEPSDTVQHGEVRWVRELVPPAARTDSLADIAQVLGARVSDPQGPAPDASPASMSGSRVVAATDTHGRPAVLKVTSHPDEPSPRAEREYLFYTRVAPALPIPTPELVARQRTPWWTAVLLRRYRPVDGTELSIPQWGRFAEDLAVLHEIDVPGALDAPLLTWDPPELDAARDLPTIRSLWDTPGTQRVFRAVIGSRDRLQSRISAVPTGLIHGDCHVGNLLKDEGDRFMLTDWQDVRLGSGTDDLAFLLTRAIPSGHELPRDELVSRYAAARGLAPSTVERAVTARQLLIMALQFPSFTPFLGPAAKANLHSAFLGLAAEC